MSRPNCNGERMSVGYRVDPVVVERLDAFCRGENGYPRLNRSAIVELALTRLLDQLQDNPANLFSK
jgi:hypothetical protein